MFKQYFWKGIPTNYEVNEHGIVRNMRTGKVLKTLEFRGYPYVSIYLDKKYRKDKDNDKYCGEHVQVHRMVAETFIPNPEHKEQVNHKNGDKRNSHVSNLEWVTMQENIAHAIVVLGSGFVDQKGSKNYASKYTEDQVRELCELIEKGYSYSELCKMSEIGAGTIMAIMRGEQWTHVSKDYKLPEIKKMPRLTESQIYQICEVLAKDGKTPYNQIAKTFGTSRKTVQRIYNKTHYKHITEQFTFADRVKEHCNTLRAAASLCRWRGLKKKDIKIRKYMCPLDRKYFDIVYDIAKLSE